MGRDQALRLWQNLAGLGPRRIVALVVVGLAVIAMVGLASVYLGKPQQQVLYSGLTRDDVMRVGVALREAGIDFDVSLDGTEVSVNQGTAAQARMLLAEKGLPQNAAAGYDLFNQIGTFGLTSFMQGVTKTRALEGELVRSILSMKGIQSARVHLVLPDRASFRAENAPPSASVVIRTVTPADATPAQAIRHLVAAAVPGLKLDNVTVLNTEGAILATGDDLENPSVGRMAMVSKTVNQDLETKIRRTLEPYLGMENFQVSVTSVINMDRQVISETIFDPDSRVERSISTVRQNAVAQNSRQDAATTVQNQIPEENTGTDAGSNSAETNDRREETTNFELSSRKIETESEGFQIEKLSIAVLVNKTSLEGGGDVAQQLADIEQLVSSATGYSQPRGDQLKVAAVSFVTHETSEAGLPEPGFVGGLMAQMGSVLNAVAFVVATILVIFLGLRPAIRAILERGQSQAAVPQVHSQSNAAFNAALAEAEIQSAIRPDIPSSDAVPDSHSLEAVMRRMPEPPQKRLEKLVELDEAKAAAILQQWLRQEQAA